MSISPIASRTLWSDVWLLTLAGIVTPADFVRVARVERHLSELIPLFGSTGHHHIPIVGADNRLVGIVTQSDIVAALSGSAAASQRGT